MPQVRNDVREIDWFMASIRRLESGSYGGNYRAVNPRTGALGAYQIMPGNWTNWTRKWGIGGADWRDREAQDYVARKQMEQYLRNFGTWELVAVAWFAGHSRARKVRDEGFGSLGDFGRRLKGYAGVILKNMDKAPDQYLPNLDDVDEAIRLLNTGGLNNGQSGGDPQGVLDDRIASNTAEPFTPEASDPNQQLAAFLSGLNQGVEPERISPLRGNLTRMLSTLSDAVAGGGRSGLPPRVPELQPDPPEGREPLEVDDA